MERATVQKYRARLSLSLLKVHRKSLQYHLQVACRYKSDALMIDVGFGIKLIDLNTCDGCNIVVPVEQLLLA